LREFYASISRINERKTANSTCKAPLEQTMNLMARIEPTLGSLEGDYRLNFLKDDIKLSTIGIIIWTVLTIAFAYNDYLFFGNTAQFWLLAFCRAALVSYGIVLLFVFTKLGRVAIYERLVFSFLIAAVRIAREAPHQCPAEMLRGSTDRIVLHVLYRCSSPDNPTSQRHRGSPRISSAVLLSSS